MIHGSVNAISIKVIFIKTIVQNDRHTFWAHVFRAVCSSFYFRKLEFYDIISRANLTYALPRETTGEPDKQVERKLNLM